MKCHSAIIFPDTVPDEQALFPLVLVFQPIVYCQPVEKEGEEDEGDSPVCKELVRQALCQGIFPAPLGQDRERFENLLSDLRHRRDDYAAQLAHVSLSGLGASAGKGTETRSSIVSGLLKGHGIESERRDKKAMLLWQARLVLKLGEFMDEDQRMLAKDMQSLSEREKGLFSELRKESEDTFSLTRELSGTSTDDEGMQRLRLKAWSRIFALGSSAPVEERIFITRNSEAFDRLADEYERTYRKLPRELISLLLPARIPDTSNMIAMLDRFSDEAALYLEGLYELLGGSTDKKGLRENFSTDGTGAWNTLLENQFPVNDYGRSLLKLYDFGSVSPQRIFLDSFGFDEDKLLNESAEKPETGIVMGVLTRL